MGPLYPSCQGQLKNCAVAMCYNHISVSFPFHWLFIFIIHSNQKEKQGNFEIYKSKDYVFFNNIYLNKFNRCGEVTYIWKENWRILMKEDVSRFYFIFRSFEGITSGSGGSFILLERRCLMSWEGLKFSIFTVP